MSAFIVSRAHINYLVNALEQWKDSYYGEKLSPNHLGNLLWQENIASVQSRYSDSLLSGLPGPIGENFDFKYRPLPDPVDPVQVIKACHSYSYQSCEHPGWPESEAYAWIAAIIKLACQHLPGYEEAKWAL